MNTNTRTKTFSIVAILIVASLLLAGCNARASAVPVISLSVSSLTLDAPGYVVLAMSVRDNSLDGFSGPCMITNGTPEPVFAATISEPWADYVRVDKTTTFTVVCSNNVGVTMTNLTIKVRAP